MKKADYKFHRDKKEQINDLSKPNDGSDWFFQKAANKPIFIPKRKKKK